MIDYTGHPLVDIGIATILAFVGKRDPTTLTEADLERVADYITEQYTRQPLKSFLTVAFPNSGFTQPAFEKQPERRLAYAERVVRSYRADTPTQEERCVFTGQPAVAIAFGDKEGLPAGRAFRQHIPLLTGEDVINFHPYGDAGLPVSGEAMLAIQAFPLGCAKCGGRLLAVHSDNPDLTLHFADRFLEANRRAVLLAQETGSTKMPESARSHRTLLIETLLTADRMQSEARREEQPFSLTAYHLSNSGQGVDLNIYYLPLEIMGFLRDMRRQDNYPQWQAIVQRAEVPLPKKGGRKTTWNSVYEDLFQLPDKAPRFVRRYFLLPALHSFRFGVVEGKPHLVSWELITSFLRRVMNMTKDRIQQIRQMGDRLAEYLHRGRDRFFETNFGTNRYAVFRTVLLRANRREIQQGLPPLIGFDPYIEVFELAEEEARSDWRLARDLVMIRMVERLYELGQLDTLSEFASDIDENEDKVEEGQA
ncbi:MAG: type I-B CRISPR-associated protein Cas8b1/Cst1 [Anaerolineae bacterium]|nr:type I-B CRISPR-associated protein Cas8b1/Cst1 [Anaerolineae bacterium]